MTLRLNLSLFSALFFCMGAFAQLVWESRSSMPQYGRHEAVSFELNGKIYVGLGRLPNGSYTDDFWEYDPITDIWTEKASYPGGAMFSSAFFSLNNKGYVCGGYNTSSGTSQDLYEYNPSTNTWTKRANFGGGTRYAASSFVINDTAYVGTGASTTGTSNYKNDFWRYDATSNSWTQIANYPGGNVINLTSFSIGQYGYSGNSTSTSASPNNSFYKYNPTTNSWSSISTMPGSARRITSSFTLDSVAYVGCGTTSGSPVTNWRNDFYKYSPASNSWTHFTSNDNFTNRIAPIFVNVGDTSIYAAIGHSSIGSLTDLWQLKMDTLYCDLFDTTFINDTTFITDTLYVNDTTFYNDTTFIDVYDTTNITVFDTTKITLYDTTEIFIYDTTFVSIYDTTYIQINDTVFIYEYDTIPVYIIDTIYQTVYDTNFITLYDTNIVTLYTVVQDTLNVYLYDSTGGCGNLEIKIYPNPTSEFVYLFTKQSGCLEAATITLYDQLGKTLQTITINSDITRIDMRGYAKELYFLKLQDKTGREMFTKKIIIR